MKKEILCVIILFCCLSSYLRDANASSTAWMQIGTYVKYGFNSMGFQYTNQSTVFFNESMSAVFEWECSGFKGDLFELNVSLSLKGVNVTQFFSTILYADFDNRVIFLANGTSIGQTRLWGPSDPQQGESILLWAADAGSNSSSIIGEANLGYYSETIQGVQHIYKLKGSGLIYGVTNIITAYFDVDSGVMIDCYLNNEPTLYALGINDVLRDGYQYLVETNINLGHSSIQPTPLLSQNVSAYQYILVVPIVGLPIILAVIHKLRMKNRYRRRYKC